MLVEKAKKDCEVDWLPVVKDVMVKTVPLQIIQLRKRPSDDKLDTFSDCRNRDEIIKQSYENPVGNISAEEFFKEAAKQLNDNKKNVVAVIGHPGVGKSTLTKEILRKTVKENLYKATYVFYLKFRDVDYKKETDLLTFLTADSLPLEWKSKQDRRNAVLRKLDKDEKVLLILDGLDEAFLTNVNDNLDDMAEAVLYNSNVTANFGSVAIPEIFIKNILSGQIFFKAKKLITSRPRQLYKLSQDLLPKLVLQISGIDQAAQRQLCQYICKERSNQVFSLVKDQPDLVSYCFIPAICTLVMHCIDQVHKTRESKNVPKTISNVFAYVLSLFVGTKHLPLIALPILEKYAKLAWELFKNNKVYFHPSDLEIAKISQSELNAFLVTTTADGKLAMVKGEPTKRMYFSHLLWQELLVAFYFIFFCSAEELKKQLEFLDFGGGKMEMIIKFMFGLCNCFCSDILKEKFGLFPSNEHARILKEWAFSKNMKFFSKNRFVSVKDNSCNESESDNEKDRNTEVNFGECRPLLSWAHEMSDELFSREISERLPNKLHFRYNQVIHPMDIAVLHNLFNARKSLKEFKNRKGYTIIMHNPQFVGDSFVRFFKELAHACSIQAVEKVMSSNPLHKILYYFIY